MYLLELSLVVSLVLSGTLALAAYVLSKKQGASSALASPFECGFSSTSYWRPLFSIHFFLIALIFLVFDVELILLFPLVVSLGVKLETSGLIMGVLMLVVLTLGTFYEWAQLGLEWSEFS